MNAKGPLPQVLSGLSQRALSQECHAPDGSVGEALWITLQIEGVTAYKSAALIMGCQEEQLIIVQGILWDF